MQGSTIKPKDIVQGLPEVWTTNQNGNESRNGYVALRTLTPPLFQKGNRNTFSKNDILRT